MNPDKWNAAVVQAEEDAKKIMEQREILLKEMEKENGN